MRAYVLTTGVVFGLIVIAHAARIVAEGIQVAGNPFFVITTALAAGLVAWASRLLFHSTGLN
jgi:hypothetical protein